MRHYEGAKRILVASYVLIAAFAAHPSQALAQADLNCNGIARDQERKCVDYFINGNGCPIEVYIGPLRDCDDYVAPGYGVQATCGPTLASDRDRDLRGDACDNCPAVNNPDQKDSTGTGIGDACNLCLPGVRENLPGYVDARQVDSDKDGKLDHCDNCRGLANPLQEDRDALLCPSGGPCPDGIGDACDNCPAVYNPDQKRSTDLGIGDACNLCLPGVRARLPQGYSDPRETDSDRDTVPDRCDNCEGSPNPDQTDSDSDGLGDVCDPCPASSDPADGDRDGIPDACDNCPHIANPAQTDSDAFLCPAAEDEGTGCPDGVGDACDNCPKVWNKSQVDLDEDGIGDECVPYGGRGCRPASVIGMGPRSTPAPSLGLLGGLIGFVLYRRRNRNRLGGGTARSWRG